MTTEAAEAATSAIAAAASGTGTTILETIVASADEVCLWYVEAASDTAVAAVFVAATVPVDRISQAARLGSR